MKTKRSMEELLKGDQRIWNQGGPKARYLTKQISMFISEKMFESMNKVIKKGRFPHRSEFIRFVIGKWLDENKEWL